jgi:hypothetical protein
MANLKDLLEEFDKISDKEAKTAFGKLKDKDIDNDGDTDKTDSYLHKKLGTVALKTEEEEIDEMSTTAGVPGYQTPFAFGAADDEAMEKMGYKKVKTKKDESVYKQMMNQLFEMRYSDYKNDASASPKTKVNKSIAEVNRLLGEIEKIVHRNIRLKTEMGVNSNDYWKNTSRNFGKISERLVRINNKLKELSQ